MMLCTSNPVGGGEKKKKGPTMRQRLLQLLVNTALFLDLSLSSAVVNTFPPFSDTINTSSQPFMLTIHTALTLGLSLLAGILVDVFNCGAPLCFGLGVNFISAMAYAYTGQHASLIVNFATCFQGVGSAFVRVAAAATLAAEFKDHVGRVKAMSVAAICISAGALFGPILATFNRSYPFVAIGCFSLSTALGLLGLYCWNRRHQEADTDQGQVRITVRIRQCACLLIDPIIIICVISIMAAMLSPAFTEPVLDIFKRGYYMHLRWKIGRFLLFPPLLMFLSIETAAIIRRPRNAWVSSVFEVWIIGISTVLFGYFESGGYTYGYSNNIRCIIFLAGQALGIAIFLLAMLILFAYRVDNHHGVPIYGSAYAIANMSTIPLFITSSFFMEKFIDTTGFRLMYFIIGTCVCISAPLLGLTSRIHRKTKQKPRQQKLAGCMDTECMMTQTQALPSEPVLLSMEPLPSISGIGSVKTIKQ